MLETLARGMGWLAVVWFLVAVLIVIFVSRRAPSTLLLIRRTPPTLLLVRRTPPTLLLLLILRTSPALLLIFRVVRKVVSYRRS